MWQKKNKPLQCEVNDILSTLIFLMVKFMEENL
jgi:hypothetical protein